MNRPVDRAVRPGVVLLTAPRGSASRLPELEVAAGDRPVVRVDHRVGDPPWGGLERLVPAAGGPAAAALRRHLGVARARPAAEHGRARSLLAVDLAAVWAGGTPPVLDGLDAADPEVAAVVGQALVRLARAGGQAVVGATTPAPGEHPGAGAAVVLALAADPAVVHVAAPATDHPAAPTGDLANAVVGDLATLAAAGRVPRRWVSAVAGRRGAPPEVAARIVDEALAAGRLTGGDDVLHAPPHGSTASTGDPDDPPADRSPLAWAVLVAHRDRLADEAPTDLLGLVADVVGPDAEADTVALLVAGAEAATWTDPPLATRLLAGARRAAPVAARVGGETSADRLAAPLVRLLRRYGDWERAAAVGRAASGAGGLDAADAVVDWTTALAHVGAAAEAVDALEAAMRTDRPPAERSLLRRQLARALGLAGRHAEALAALAADDVDGVRDRDRGAARAGRVLLAMVAGSGEEVLAARRAARASSLPMPGLAADRLFHRAWAAAADLDMAAAEAALLGRTMGDHRGTPLPWRDVRAAYDAGAWDDVLALADLLVGAGTSDVLADYEAARSQVAAAAVSLARGEARAAAARLAGVPDPLVGGASADAVRIGVTATLGRTADALARGRSAVDRLAREGVGQGEETVWAAVVDVLTGAPGAGHGGARPPGHEADLADALAAAETVARRVGSERATVLALRARATVRGDAGAGREAAALAARRDDRFDLARAEFAAGAAGDRPQVRLRVAHDAFRELGAEPWRRAVAATLRERRLPVPRRRPARTDDDDLDRLVRRGLGNREIAHHLGVADRTVEARVAALLAASGSGSRIRHLASPPRELAAAAEGDPLVVAVPPAAAAVVTVPARETDPADREQVRDAVRRLLPELRDRVAVEARRAHLLRVLAEAREPYRAQV